MSRSLHERPRVACLALLLLGLVAPGARAMPQLDQVHRHMEPPPPKVKLPHVRSPFSRSVIGPKQATALLPAACVALKFLAPDLATRLLFHLICYLGALIEPFETVLPKRSVLLGFVLQMRNARNAYDDKHGIPRMQQQFFEDEEEADAMDAAGGAEDDTEDEAGDAAAAEDEESIGETDDSE